jgi:hypothetical protein
MESNTKTTEKYTKLKLFIHSVLGKQTFIALNCSPNPKEKDFLLIGLSKRILYIWTYIK